MGLFSSSSKRTTSVKNQRQVVEDMAPIERLKWENERWESCQLHWRKDAIRKKHLSRRRWVRRQRAKRAVMGGSMVAAKVVVVLFAVVVVVQKCNEVTGGNYAA